MRARCQHPVNVMLPWFVNGTLTEEEGRSVRSHLETCFVCAREVSGLKEISSAFELHDLPEERLPARVVASSPLTGRRAAYAAAASLAAAALAVSWFLMTGGGPTAAGPSTIGAVAVLDLAAGPTRASIPESAAASILLPPDLDQVVIRFMVPIEGAAQETVELCDASGRALAPRERLSGRDEFGAYALSFPARLFPSTGEYILHVRSTGTDGAAHHYPFPFRVELTADSL